MLVNYNKLKVVPALHVQMLYLNLLVLKWKKKILHALHVQMLYLNEMTAEKVISKGWALHVQMLYLNLIAEPPPKRGEIGSTCTNVVFKL